MKLHKNTKINKLQKLNSGFRPTSTNVSFGLPLPFSFPQLELTHSFSLVY